MDSSIKKWHKSVLFACVALLAFGGTALAQSDYISGSEYGVTLFTAPADIDLKGVGFWTIAPEMWQVLAYDVTGTGTVGSLMASNSSSSFDTGYSYYELLFASPISLTAGDSVYIGARVPLNKTHAADLSTPVDNVSYFSADGTTWTDLFNGPWSGLTVNGTTNPLNASANFIYNAITSPAPNITATALEGTWTITDQSFDGDHTLNVDKTADVMEPFVMQIDVDSDMGQIAITETVLNDIAERDWIGYGFQLGFWDDVNDRFISSVDGDGLSFGFSSSPDFGSSGYLGTEDRYYFSDGLVEPGESAAFQLLINLPGGVDNFTFALRQYAVPEPSTFLLLAMSGVMLLCGRRRR